MRKEEKNRPKMFTPLKSPFDDKFAAQYRGGKNGDPSCRTIVIDGSNVAREHGRVGEIKRKHGNQEVFSILGIKIAVEKFYQLGCRKVNVFLPPIRQSNEGLPKIPHNERALQREMENIGIIKYTPGRKIQGRGYVNSYDDGFILEMATTENGIVVSKDHFRDLFKNPFKDTISNRLLG